jgi:hypothetical protein
LFESYLRQMPKKKGSVHKYMQRENEQRVIDHFSNLKLKDNKDEEINHWE